MELVPPGFHFGLFPKGGRIWQPGSFPGLNFGDIGDSDQHRCPGCGSEYRCAQPAGPVSQRYHRYDLRAVFSDWYFYRQESQFPPGEENGKFG